MQKKRKLWLRRSLDGDDVIATADVEYQAATALFETDKQLSTSRQTGQNRGHLLRKLKSEPRLLIFAVVSFLSVSLVAYSQIWRRVLLLQPTGFGPAQTVFGEQKIDFEMAALGGQDHPPFDFTVESLHGCKKLIIVAGHAVLQPSAFLTDANLRADNAWFLLDYQLNSMFPVAFLAHITAGIKLARQHADSLLLFSGGVTRRGAGPWSEALSYFIAADRVGPEEVSPAGYAALRSRIATEEHARDSFENLLFSLCRYRELVGTYPDEVFVISFSFKQERFENIHRQALRFPESKFHFVPVDPPYKPMGNDPKLRISHPKFDLERWSYFELNQAILPFIEDPYGCHSEILRSKKGERDPYKRAVPYELSCPELQELLAWRGPELFPKQLPWATDK